MEGLAGFVGLFLLLVAILAFLMPFFVLRIRNELISMNKKTSTLVELLSHVNGGNNDDKIPLMTNCDWCKQRVPLSKAIKLKGHTLCSSCWQKAQAKGNI